jgi:hypothetical protein
MSERAQRADLTNELLSILYQEGFRDPLHDAVLEGGVSRAGLKQWFLQAALIVRQFPRFISCPHADAQELLRTCGKKTGAASMGAITSRS